MTKAKMIFPAIALIFAMQGDRVLADQRTDIHHADGTTSTVVTDRYGTQVVTPGHGGGQFGQSIPHEDVVKLYTRPGSDIERR